MRKGFTLVELLVAIAIISLLAAILFPVFARVREGSRRSVCQSNLRQIGLAIKMYLQDYDETHPPENAEVAGELVGWAFLIQPYLNSTQVLQCPTEETDANPSPSEAGYTDYGYNRYALKLPGASFAAPSNTILCLDIVSGDSGMWDDGSGDTYFDCRGDSGASGATPGPATWLYRPNQESRLRYAERHLEKGNYLFADGHVRCFGPLSVYNNCTSPTSKPAFAYR